MAPQMLAREKSKAGNTICSSLVTLARYSLKHNHFKHEGTDHRAKPMAVQKLCVFDNNTRLRINTRYDPLNSTALFSLGDSFT
eukprot:scaffold8382_cov38-Prasinocladus_malaysianus.AAC.2